jgi:hypothetical protein
MVYEEYDIWALSLGCKTDAQQKEKSCLRQKQAYFGPFPVEILVS